LQLVHIIMGVTDDAPHGKPIAVGRDQSQSRRVARAILLGPNEYLHTWVQSLPWDQPPKIDGLREGYAAVDDEKRAAKELHLNAMRKAYRMAVLSGVNDDSSPAVEGIMG
jgi:hypothetical protein